MGGSSGSVDAERIEGTLATRWLVDRDRFMMAVEPAPRQTSDMTASIAEGVQRFTPDNGPTTIVRADPSARVFAMHILVRDRYLWEQQYGTGTIDLLHRLIAENSDDQIDELAARFKTSDNPRIPYDNYYTAPEFSFIRFEMLPDKWQEGIALVAEMMASLPTDDRSWGSAQHGSSSAGSSQGRSPTSVGRQALRHRLVPNSSLEASVYGDVASVDPNDLEQLRKSYFHPENLIITVAGPVPVDDVAPVIEQEFQQLNGGDFTPPEPLPFDPDDITIDEMLSDSITLGRAQGALVLGKVIRRIDESDRAALTVANSYLNEQMGMIIREEYGLAYSLGSSIRIRKTANGETWGYWEISIATRPENLDRVEELMHQILNDIASHTFAIEEISQISNAIAGRLMMRAMSRIGQAYSMGVGEFFYGDPESSGQLAQQLPRVTAQQVSEVAGQYLDAEGLFVLKVK
ncbi:MAG: pitrilysin family protein [Candidatus Electryoneaceae bacterium]|nr:pitrilysin family protein [Candidatus Electryoneaceae bacterium]